MKVLCIFVLRIACKRAIAISTAHGFTRAQTKGQLAALLVIMGHCPQHLSHRAAAIAMGDV